MSRFGLLLCSFVFVLLAATGCMGGDAISGYSPPKSDGLTPQQRMNKQIKDIQDNPNMPQTAKDTAIAQIQAHANPGR